MKRKYRANSPSYKFSISLLTAFETAGLAPSVDIAIVKGRRLISDGTIKFPPEGMSMTFTRDSASSAIFLFMSSEEVPAITTKAPLRSPFL
jgi:hypothetical protein